MPDENLLFYINMAGELFYIISHRMKSQAVEVQLQTTVHNDLAIAILDPRVIQEIVSNSVSWIKMSFEELKTVMTKIVHSSIMTVNAYSMEKLFELTLIATKYQYIICPFPKDILLIALNHLDSIRKYCTESYAIQLAENLHYSVVDSYGKKAGGTMQEYRFKILDYLLEVKLKMTNLIKLGLQNQSSGGFIRTAFDHLIHPECVKPGSIEVIEYSMLTDKLLSTHIVQFDDTQLHRRHRKQHSLELNGDRVLILGLSIYEPEYLILLNEKDAEARNNAKTPKGLISMTSPTKCKGKSNSFAVPGLELCNKLISGFSQSTNSEKERAPEAFSLSFPEIVQNSPRTSTIESNLMKKSENKSTSTTPSLANDINVIRIDARTDRAKSKSQLAVIANELNNLDLDEKDKDRDSINSQHNQNDQDKDKDKDKENEISLNDMF